MDSLNKSGNGYYQYNMKWTRLIGFDLKLWQVLGFSWFFFFIVMATKFPFFSQALAQDPTTRRLWFGIATAHDLESHDAVTEELVYQKFSFRIFISSQSFFFGPQVTFFMSRGKEILKLGLKIHFTYVQLPTLFGIHTSDSLQLNPMLGVGIHQ